ncbi:MAG: hypothetical protein ACO29V_09945 [Limnohabitans sp.]
MWGEPWSIVAEHPVTGEPFGLVLHTDHTFTEAEDYGRQLLATFRLSGSYLPSSAIHPAHGHYLFTYTAAGTSTWALNTIWAESLDDAELRLNMLAAEGILFMPSPG